MPNAVYSFLRFVTKATLNAISGGVIGDFTVDCLPDIATTVYTWWGKKTPGREQRNELEAIAGLDRHKSVDLAKLFVQQEQCGQTPDVQDVVVAYVSMVPAAIRQSQRSRHDVSGKTIAHNLEVNKPEDLIPLLPPRLPLIGAGKRCLGDWQLIDLLGIGGFGEVWRGRNEVIGEEAAFKFCVPSAGRVLQREAELLGRIQRESGHRGIVPLLDTSLGTDPAWLRYQMIDGVELGAVLRDFGGGMSARNSVSIIEQLAMIVGSVHRLSPPIVHRDLKPGNVLVKMKSKDKMGDIFVTDFGIGAVASKEAQLVTRNGTREVRGYSSVLSAFTPLYASPQQQQGMAPDPRDDVYSLGVLWWQMLSGDTLSGAPSGFGWMKKAAEKGLSNDLMMLMGRCFSTNPDERPQDCSVLFQFLQMLFRNKDNIPPVVKPVPVAEEVVLVKRKVRRLHKTWKMSAIDAAYRVLQEAGKPMRIMEITDLARDKGYWDAPMGGVTPWSTISARIYTDIMVGGSRFWKNRGLFGLVEWKNK